MTNYLYDLLHPFRQFIRCKMVSESRGSTSLPVLFTTVCRRNVMVSRDILVVLVNRSKQYQSSVDTAMVPMDPV